MFVAWRLLWDKEVRVSLLTMAMRNNFIAAIVNRMSLMSLTLFAACSMTSQCFRYCYWSQEYAKLPILRMPRLRMHGVRHSTVDKITCGLILVWSFSSDRNQYASYRIKG
jgi:hypothetical protein